MTRRPAYLSALVLALALGVGAFVAPTRAQACPMCVENLPGEEAGEGEAVEGEPARAASDGGLAAGFYYSILVMIAVPFAMAGSFGGWVYLEQRRRSSTTG